MRVCYIAPDRRFGTLDDPRLLATTERHKISLPPPELAGGDPAAELARNPALLGMVLEMATGSLTATDIALVTRAIDLRRRAWLYWPDEGVVEHVTRERIASYRRHWRVMRFHERAYEPAMRIVDVPRRLWHVLRDTPVRDLPRWAVRRLERTGYFSGPVNLLRRLLGTYTGAANPSLPGEASAQALSASPEAPQAAAPSAMVRHARRLGAVRAARQAAKAVPFPTPVPPPGPDHRIPGCGVYLRTDFWSPIESGGSYGHTCYVAKELAAVTESFVCFMANRFKLLDEYGLRQVVMPLPSDTRNEDDMAIATEHYVKFLTPAFEQLRPAYIYERLCLGNYAGALLSRAFGVPYILEYNGSEISMRRSFEGAGYVYEAEYLEAEALAFEQATLITVVSVEIRKGLIARGVNPEKILVNPNGVDLAAYAPAEPEERDAIRRSLGFGPADRVVGFTGTFGGWHGIDVLSDAIPRICQAAPQAKLLLIGDGHFKQLVDHAVAAYRLERRVRSVGRVPQTEGARLLKACDIYVSPHSTHMVDSKFFGSPTKIFEYMALGGGIVASDLEQIGQVLSPSLTPAEAVRGAPVADERSVLCVPGDINQFVQGVLALVEHPVTARALGRNARLAAGAHYSWTRHVANLWPFLAGDTMSTGIASDLRRKPKRQPEPVYEMAGAAATPARADAGSAERPRVVVTGDAYKDEVQRQWNSDPAGSHYVEEAAPHTTEWFLEAERYRYGSYAPWMRETMEFEHHRGEKLLEIGGGMGTDLAQFAAHGAHVTDVDLSSGHLKLAKENFAVRGLEGQFILQDAESLVFEDNTFDVVYSNGVIHHTPNTHHVVREMLRVLKPGGRAIVMVYAENSLHYWRNLVWVIGVKGGQLRKHSMGEIMSRTVERSDNASARPLVKVYTPERLRELFDGFEGIEIVKRQMAADEVPRALAWMPRRHLARLMGWNLIIKARKPKR